MLLKKLSAIFFIMLFLFNLAGYQLVFFIAKQKAASSLSAIIDNNDYAERDLLKLSVDMNMPYQAQSTDFERVDGEISLNGKLYKYVKRKVSQGKLILLCLPDYESTKLQSGREEFFRLSGQLVNNKPSKEAPAKSTSVKIAQSDYEQQEFSFKHVADYIFHKYPISENQYLILTAAPGPPGEPPKKLALFLS